MTEIPQMQPFQPSPLGLTPLQPAVPETAVTERPKRRAGGKKKTVPARKPRAYNRAPNADFSTEPLAAANKVRKPRAVKEAPKARKLDIGVIVSATAGLKPDDARTLVRIHALLGEHNAKSRVAIIAALGKLFG